MRTIDVMIPYMRLDVKQAVGHNMAVAKDEELDPVVRGIRCSSPQGIEQSRIKVGYARNLVVEDRRAVGDGTVSLAERTAVLEAKDVDG